MRNMYWGQQLLFIMELVMVCCRDKNWYSHLDIPMDLCLDMMKVSNFASLMVNFLYLYQMMDTHLEFMFDLVFILIGLISWVVLR